MAEQHYRLTNESSGVFHLEPVECEDAVLLREQELIKERDRAQQRARDAVEDAVRKGDRIRELEREQQIQAIAMASGVRERDALRNNEIGDHPAFIAMRQDRDAWRGKVDEISRPIRVALVVHGVNNEGMTLPFAVAAALDTLNHRARELERDRDKWRKRAEREPSSTVWTQADHSRLCDELRKHGTDVDQMTGSLVHLVARTMDRLANERDQAKRRNTAIAADRDRTQRLAVDRLRHLTEVTVDRDRAQKTLRAIRKTITGNMLVPLDEQVRVTVKELRAERDAVQTALVELQTKLHRWADGVPDDVAEESRLNPSDEWDD